jgi:type IV pilus assembly protein PilX
MTLAQHQHVSFKHAQSGVVLFLAMIALVVMSLAAVALIRSVDTNSMVAGNLAYKQTAAISSSYGIEAMADTIGVKALAYGNADDAANGYYATCKTFGTGATDALKCDGANLTADASWVAGTKSALAAGTGLTAGKDIYGNTIQYIVERMCHTAGAPSNSACLQAGVDLDNNSKNVLNEPNAGAPEVATDLPIYRVTVRVAGPKNTISYIQAFIS